MITVNEPLDPVTARGLAKQALEVGRVILDDHVRARMAQRRVTLADVYRVLRAGAPNLAHGAGEQHDHHYLEVPSL
jgi:hypothetical protein